MSDLLKSLSNIRSLRVLARETSLTQLESALDKLSAVVEEKRAEVKKELQAVKERQERLEKYKELLEQDGVSADELHAFLSHRTAAKQRKTRAPRAAKYQFVTESGESKTWTGQGRMPREIKAAVDAGKSLADFEIK